MSDRTAVTFAALGDPARLRVLRALSRGTRCVCELQADLSMAQSALSYHLAILRDAGLVTSRRRGRRIDYRIYRSALRRAMRAVDTLDPKGVR